MMKKTVVIIAMIISLNFISSPVLAVQQGPYLGLEYGEASGLGQESVESTVGSIIKVILGLLGVIAVSLIVYAGFLWMTGGGNEEQITKARSILMASVIGLGIILSAWAITRFVLLNLGKATTGSEVRVN